jgi:hypothetical protein
MATHVGVGVVNVVGQLPPLNGHTTAEIAEEKANIVVIIVVESERVVSKIMTQEGDLRAKGWLLNAT